MHVSARLIFHPACVLSLSITGALAFALVANVVFQGALRDLLVYYFAPVGAPFIAFLFDRCQHPGSRWIDVPMVLLALTRAVFPVPFVSGHALFLVYAIFTTYTWPARLLAVLVLAQVVYLKVFVWHDFTLIGGAVLGAAAAWACQRVC